MSYPIRPFYMIAHRCNEVVHIRRVLNKCFNGIEIDVIAKGNDIVVHHPGIDGSTPWPVWLKAAEELPQRLIERWALLMFDIKETKPLIPETLRDSMRRSPTLKDVPRTFSVQSVKDANATFTGDFIRNLEPVETVDISYNQPPSDVATWMKDRKFSRGWYGDGLFVGGGEQRRIDANLSEAIRLRDIDGHIQRVYSWTYEKNSSVKEKILMSCDGLLVNTGIATAGTGNEEYYKWADQYQSIMDDSAVKSVARLATQADFKNPLSSPIPKPVKIKSKLNGKYMVARDGISNEHWIYCRDVGKKDELITFVQIGADSACCFQVPGQQLFLSFQDTGGAVKLYKTNERAIYRLEARGDAYAIYDIYHGQYMWLKTNLEPYVTGAGNPGELSALWVLEPA